MKHIHFIAVGGAIMHNLAIALHNKGYKVTGSDDEIFEPSRSRLQKYGLLPAYTGWNPEIITNNTHAVILGMHAHEDNPELIKARELGLKIYSFPEFLYLNAKDKKRIVVGGSHGKTTTTAMIMHVLKMLNYNFDYMVGSQLEGFETMVRVSDAPIAVFEGDEYLSSKLDPRPKFHLYKPHIAILTGIAWDHINVFPTFENYTDQFQIFAESIEIDGVLIHYKNDPELKKIAENLREDINSISYGTPRHFIKDGHTYIQTDKENYKLSVFGKHNLQNMAAAYYACKQLGVKDHAFYTAISSFKGAGKRLQLIDKNENTAVYLDFAHSPSKLLATTSAVKIQYPDRKLVACMELHTFSSLRKDFLPQYKNTMKDADIAFIYFNPETIKHKRLEEITAEQVAQAFGTKNVRVFTKREELVNHLTSLSWQNSNLLLMSSGNFSGVDINKLAKMILTN